MYTLLFSFYFFLIGSIFGSFLNMLVYRINKGQNILGRSFCDNTKKQLTIKDLIPIVSYIYYKGKCRECGEKLPVTYPIVEVIVGLLSVVAFLLIKDITTIESIFTVLGYWLINFSVFFTFFFFAYYDFLYWEVDVKSLIFFAAILVILNLINALLFYTNGLLLPYFSNPIDNLFGALVLAGIIFIVFKLTNGGGMGEGDIYLFAFSGLVTGFLGGILALVFTCIYGSIIGIIKATKTGKLKGTKIQLAPFIALGTITVFIFREQILKLLQFYY